LNPEEVLVVANKKLSIPSWSWKMVLVGDPLYRPFKAADEWY